MVANPDYWGGAVPVPKVYFPVYTDEHRGAERPVRRADRLDR